jgi:CheY-like chemotaxis protein
VREGSGDGRAGDLKKEAKRVRLVHWKADEARERARILERAGYEVAHELPGGGAALLRALREDPPDAIVIDLSRVPSHGRDVALAVRQAKATRLVPIVFVEGDPERVSRLKALVPDAVHAGWKGIRSALKGAIARPPREVARPASLLACYSGTPLSRKLGIKPGAVVTLVASPAGFRGSLGSDLPPGVGFVESTLAASPRAAKPKTNPKPERGSRPLGISWRCAELPERGRIGRVSMSGALG